MNGTYYMGTRGTTEPRASLFPSGAAAGGLIALQHAGGGTYVLDAGRKQIYKLTEQGLMPGAAFSIDSTELLPGMAADQHYFYLIDAEHVYRVSPDGEVQTYASLKGAGYRNPGDPEEAYQMNDVPEVLRSSTKFEQDTPIAVDRDGNLLFFDWTEQSLKKLHIFRVGP